MDFQMLRVYFKAGILVPFYLSLAAFLMVILPAILSHGISLEALSENELVAAFIMMPFYSGLISISGLTAFLNTRPFIARSLVLSLLSWILLPVCTIAVLLATVVTWGPRLYGMNSLSSFVSIFFFVICFFHVIGLFIAYIDFRRSMVLLIRSEEMKRMNPLTRQHEHTV